MSEMPDEIWAAPNSHHDRYEMSGWWASLGKTVAAGTDYIKYERSDIVDALRARIAELEKELEGK